MQVDEELLHSKVSSKIFLIHLELALKQGADSELGRRMKNRPLVELVASE
jgi:hypothetical protein